MRSLLETVAKLIRSEEGQDLIEYGLLVTLIALVAIAAITSTGLHVDTMFKDIASKIPA